MSRLRSICVGSESGYCIPDRGPMEKGTAQNFPFCRRWLLNTYDRQSRKGESSLNRLVRACLCSWSCSSADHSQSEVRQRRILLSPAEETGPLVLFLRLVGVFAVCCFRSVHTAATGLLVHSIVRSSRNRHWGRYTPRRLS